MAGEEKKNERKKRNKNTFEDFYHALIHPFFSLLTHACTLCFLAFSIKHILFSLVCMRMRTHAHFYSFKSKLRNVNLLKERKNEKENCHIYLIKSFIRSFGAHNNCVYEKEDTKMIGSRNEMDSKSVCLDVGRFFFLWLNMFIFLIRI